MHDKQASNTPKGVSDFGFKKLSCLGGTQTHGTLCSNRLCVCVHEHAPANCTVACAYMYMYIVQDSMRLAVHCNYFVGSS